MREELTNMYKGACTEGLFYDLGTCTTEQMLEMYRRNPEYSLKNDIPSVKFITDNVTPEVLAENGIICNKKFDNETLAWGIGTKHKGIYILNHCKGSLCFNKGEIIELYMSTGCDLSIYVGGTSHVCVTVYGYSHIDIKCNADKSSTVFLRQCAQCDPKGKVKIHKNE